MTTDPGKAKQILDDRPPFLGTWTKIYAAVLGFLGLLVLVFHLLTRILG
jgi:hypothetical protein